MNGYCPAILQHIEALAACNPAKKLSPLGFLQLVLNAMDGSATPLNDQFDSGHVKPLTVKYRKRILDSAVSDTPSACDTGNTPAYNEFTPPALLYREYALFVPDSLIRQYCKDSSQYVKIDAAGNAVMQQETRVMKEVYDMLVEAGAAVLRSINKALVTQMTTQFGVNVTSGNANARALTFDLDTVGMQDAMIQLIADWRNNELCDDVLMTGNGAFATYDLVKELLKGTATIAENAAAMMPKVYFDKDTTAIWGANQVGVFEKGSAALITKNNYIGNFARPMATSNFFTMALPVDQYCCPQENLDKLLFDVQVKEFDCPVQLMINGEEKTTDGPGVLIVLSKYFTLFTKPGNLYEDADELFGTNGTLRYSITPSA